MFVDIWTKQDMTAHEKRVDRNVAIVIPKPIMLNSV